MEQSRLSHQPITAIQYVNLKGESQVHFSSTSPFWWVISYFATDNKTTNFELGLGGERRVRRVYESGQLLYVIVAHAGFIMSF